MNQLKKIVRLHIFLTLFLWKLSLNEYTLTLNYLTLKYYTCILLASIILSSFHSAYVYNLMKTDSKWKKECGQMQYFIGIVPPKAYVNEVAVFRGKWANNTIDQVVEPHITLKAQGGLTPDEKWIEAVAEVCSQTKPFSLAISEPEFFGEEILYLSAQSEKLQILHNDLVAKIAPSSELIEQYFELNHFTPHLTLAKTSYGVTRQELQDMARLVKEEVQSGFTFQVDFVRIYQENGTGRYVKYMDIPLSKEH